MKIPKHAVTNLICLLLGSILGLLCETSAVGQESANLIAGFGMPEFVSLGIRREINPFQFGIYAGAAPNKPTRDFAVTTDMYYHFAGSAERFERRPWYVRSGITFIHDETDEFIKKSLYLPVKIGREIPISKKIGLQFDAGTMFRLFEEITVIDSPPTEKNFRFYPLLSMGIFYNL